MGLIWHRPLIPEDVETAHRLLDQHQPFEEHRSKVIRIACASALHPGDAPAWPCGRRRWAERVLAADERGEVTGERSDVAQTA